MARRGLKFDPAHPEAVPLDIIEKGVKDGLVTTMAARPEKGTPMGWLSGRIMKLYDVAPVLSLVNPFPRYQYANAFRFLWEHSPAGPFDLMTKGRLAREVTPTGQPTCGPCGEKESRTAALLIQKQQPDSDSLQR
jgi:hypothetical protein